MRIHTPPIERMLARKVVDADGCWIWPGATAGTYGAVRLPQGKELVHRLSYQHFVGPIPDGCEIEHACHTADLSCPGGPCKHRLCWNPTHLAAIPHLENVRRSRHPHIEAFQRSGICQRGHILSEDNILVRWRANGVKHRCCRECINEGQRRRYAARKAG